MGPSGPTDCAEPFDRLRTVRIARAHRVSKSHAELHLCRDEALSAVQWPERSAGYATQSYGVGLLALLRPSPAKRPCLCQSPDCEISKVFALPPRAAYGQIIAESLGGQQQLTFTCRRFRKVCRRRSTPSARSCDSFLIWKRSRARRAFCYQNATKLKSGVSASSLKGWWTWSGSNRRPLPCHGSALPAAPQAHNACSAISILTYPERTVKH